MTKEILFKAKRKDNNQWVYGYLVVDNKNLYLNAKEDVYYIASNTDMYVEVMPETICQYIAETDSSGNKLFWNDEIVVPELNNRKIIIDNKGVFYIIQNFIEHGTDFYYLRNIFDKEVKENDN